MSTILIILFLISYLILAKIRLDWAVMFLIAALPSYLIRFSVFSIPFTLLEAMILISFIIWLIANLRQIINNLKLKIKLLKNPKSEIRNPKSERYPFDIEIILLLIISFIAVAVAGFSDSALGIWKAYFFEPVLVFILVMNLPLPPSLLRRGNEKECRYNILEKILWPLAISALAVSVFAIYQKFTGAFIFNELWAAEETRRVTSFFGYPNAVGLYLGPLVLIFIGWLSHQIYAIKRRVISYKLLVISFIIIISVFSIYFAKSEGALIGVAAGIAIFGLFADRRIRWAMITLIFVAGLGIIMSQPVRNYTFKKITLTDLSGEIRKQQWKETWQMMTHCGDTRFCAITRFIFGTGLANYKEAVLPYHQEGIFFNKDNDPDFRRKIVIFDDQYRAEHWQPVEIYLYPHNIFLNFWTELGLAGMLLFLWVFIKFWIIGFKIIGNWKLEIGNLNTVKEKYIVLGLLCSMIAITIHGLVDVPYFKNDLAVMFFILIAIIGLINLNNKKLCSAKKQ
ncbi:O-antigen ligase family protein [Patescibacteria group bacterium]|nr:O-antigen ligase family protein [Patescibacteria group bacterium]MBU4073149.1 O-antigen ligase family protein [Patescibacteria group bacterium]MBU4125635.1 O-antigen ligase family protein [Patescibacteria group bacterium]